MIVIGLRVYSNSIVYYAVIEKQSEDNFNFLDISQINVPLSIEWPEALNFTRNTLLDILMEYKVDNAALRIAEFGRTLNKIAIERHYIEGVIQESLASSSVNKFVAGQISELTGIANMPKTDFKKYANGEIHSPHYPTTETPNWSSLILEKRECVLACFTAFKL